MTDRPPVSTRVTAQILSVVDDDWPYAVDLARLPVAEARLRSETDQIAWEEYLAFLGVICGDEATPERLRCVGAHNMAHAARGPFRYIGALAGAIVPVYEAVFGWVMLSSIKCLRAEIERGDGAQVRIRVWIREGFAPGEPYFHTLAGTMEQTPALIGQAAARVDATIGPREATYVVHLPPGASLWARSARAWRAFSDQRGFEFAVDRTRETIQELLSDLRTANEKLEHSEERWRAVATGLPGLVLVLDGGRATARYGLDQPPPAIESAIIEAFEASHRSGPPAERRSFDVEGTATDGQPFAWSCCSTLVAPDGQSIVVAIDRTAQHRAQAALAQSEERFLHAQKMEAVGRFAGGVAHDFNNLLAAIQGHVDLLAMERDSDWAVAAHAGAISDAVSQASGLTRQLLTYVRRAPERLEVLDANAAARDAELLLRRLLGNGVTLALALAAVPCHVQIDGSRLQQVLLNLVVNASDALPDGGTIALSVTREDGEVCIAVGDDGVGMEPAVLARAMEPYFTTKDPARGTGLGLCTVYWIVEQAHGRIAIDSTPGAGTTVRVHLPEVAPDLDDSPADARPDARPPPRILLVDDEPSVRRMVATMLETQGYRVVQCASGAEALDALRSSPRPDLLLTDVNMPGMDGVELANAILAVQPATPVLLMSGKLSDVVAPTHAVEGQTRFLTKPFRLRTLTDTVAELLASG